MKVLFKFLLLAVFLWAMPAQAAYQPNYINELNQYAVWKNKNKITVWVQPCKYQQTVYNAFREWVAASGGCLGFRESTNENFANIKVYFVPTLSNNRAGETIHTSTGKYMNSAVVRIKYTNNRNPDKLMFNNEIYQVAVHEIGHALGIMGHSSNRNDIMYPTTDIIGIHASNRDVNTIREFYCSGKY